MDNRSVPEYVVRAFCRYLIAYIPSEGLRELVETMRDIYEFYLPLNEEHTPYSTTVETVEARPGDTYTRPEFHIDEDEV
jgi:hypothetical protein